MSDLSPNPSPNGGEFPINLVWPEALGEAAQVANQFVISDDISDKNGVYLLLGHVSAPVYLDPEVARQRLAERGNSLPISARGAFYMTRLNLEKLRDIINNHLAKSQEQA